MNVSADGLAPVYSSAYDPVFAERFTKQYPDLDPGIRRAVQILRHAGITTFESCQGGEGHSYDQPTVRFGGAPYEGWQALAACLAYDLPVTALSRTWTFDYAQEPAGPFWELIFREQLQP